MKNKQLYFMIIFVVIFSVSILSGCSGKNEGGAIGPVTPVMVLPITYEDNEISDKYFDVRILTCQQEVMYWDSTMGEPIINFTTFDHDKKCYWQREIKREENKYVSDSDCQISKCAFFNYAQVYSQSVKLIVYVPSLNATFLSNEIKFEIGKKYKMNLMQNGSSEITQI